jgi:mRNA interferase MazF
MIQAGQMVLFPFPYTDLSRAKLRPALVLREIPGGHDDWLVCMVSSNLGQAITGFDDVIDQSAPDFSASGLKCPSVIRAGRLLAVHASVFLGALGEISPERLEQIRSRIAEWLHNG